MDAEPRHKWHDLLVAIATVMPVFVAVAFISTLEKALLAGTVSGAMWVAISERWQFRERAGFWVLVAGFALFNAIAIWAVPISGPFKAALGVSYPLALAEGFLLHWLLGKLN